MGLVGGGAVFAAALIWLLGTFSGIFAPGYVWPGRGALSRLQACLRSGWPIARFRCGPAAFRMRRRLGRGPAAGGLCIRRCLSWLELVFRDEVWAWLGADEILWRSRYLSSSRFAVSCGGGFLSRGFLGLRTDVLGDSSKGGSL